MNFKSLPDSIGNLDLLETLEIEGPSFSFLPESIGNLHSLRNLYLYRTKIKTLPDMVGNLTKLEKIRLLCCTELEALPETIGNLRSLKSIYIRGGKMIALPESIGDISSLLGLHLQYTNIASLPASIGNLCNLVSLGIYSVQNEDRFDIIDYPDYYQDEETERKSPFAGLPSTASKLTSLKYLNLSNTEVTSLPDYLTDLPALERIDIIDCDIKTIPPVVQRLVDNRELHLIRTEEELRFAFLWHHDRRRPRRR